MNRPTVFFRRGGILALLSFAAVFVCPLVGTAVPTDYEVKAAYLLRFAEYVELPNSRLVSQEDPLVIGVLGGIPINGILEKLASSRKPGSPRIEVRQGERLEDIGPCGIIVAKPGTPGLMAWSRHQPILLVSDGPGGLDEGFHLEFRLINKTVRFGANPEAARKAGLNLRARLLASAVEVYPSRPQAAAPE